MGQGGEQARGCGGRAFVSQVFEGEIDEVEIGAFQEGAGAGAHRGAFFRGEGRVFRAVESAAVEQEVEGRDLPQGAE